MTLTQALSAVPVKKTRKTRKKAVEQPKATAPDAVVMPDDSTSAAVFATLLHLSIEQKASKVNSPVIVHFAIRDAVKEDRIDLDGEHLGDVLKGLEQGDFVKHITSAKGFSCWIPCVMDDGPPTAQKRTNKAERSSDRQRQVAALMAQHFGA